MEGWLESFARANFLRSGDTAHDLKTPLNVAVLNLELLRMRVRKLTEGAQDEKLDQYARSLELELRRMAMIFDAFFILSTPPKGEEAPAVVDLLLLCREVAAESGFDLEGPGPALVRAHEARIRQALTLLVKGTEKVIQADPRRLVLSRNSRNATVSVAGRPVTNDLELTKIFKFYYTDALGNPELSLAAARLIAETYGGELNAAEESDKVWLRLSLPLGEE